MKHLKISFTVILTSFFLLGSCSSGDDTPSQEENSTPNTNTLKPNILLIIADDMGLDATPGYDIGNVKPSMKTIESLITNGIVFNNVWSNPTCTPTRAGIITGKYGFRTGVTKVDDPLSVSETSLQKHIEEQINNTYKQAVIGKWHLSKDENHPNQMGIDYYAGSLSGGVKSYTDWDLTINGTTVDETAYVTTKYTDLAIDWVSKQNEPWFLWLAHNAPHTPFHLPPADLHFQGNLPADQGSIDADPLPYYMAAIEAMDTEIGRLLSSMSDDVRNNTIIIFVGDNGTPNQVAQEYNSRRVKGTLYQGGVNVPMVISGATVSRKNDTENTLINTTDLFATIAAITGSTATEIHDSKSFKTLLNSSISSVRNYTYSETTDDKTIRNATHKYFLFENGTEALYNLNDNPLENPNLLSTNQSPLNEADTKIKEELINELNSILK